MNLTVIPTLEEKGNLLLGLTIAEDPFWSSSICVSFEVGIIFLGLQKGKQYMSEVTC